MPLGRGRLPARGARTASPARSARIDARMPSTCPFRVASLAACCQAGPAAAMLAPSHAGRQAAARDGQGGRQVMVRKQFLIAAACAALTAVGVYLHGRPAPPSAAPTPATVRATPASTETRSAPRRRLDALVRPSSPYDEARSARFTALLAGQDFDLLVVPCMGQVMGDIERNERALASAALSTALSARTSQRIAPTAMVTRVLGEWRRYLDDGDVLQLVQLTGAEHVVVCEQASYAAPDAASKTIKLRQSLKLEYFDLSKAQRHTLLALPAATRRYEAPRDDRLLISDERPPHLGFLEVLPEALIALGFPPPAVNAPATGPSAGNVAASDALPADPAALLADVAGDAETRVRQLEFVAGLFPELPRDGRRRAATRLLLAAYALPVSHPRRPIALARGLLLLDQRPAALAALGQNDTQTARGLRAALNADLPALEAATAALPSGIDRLLAEFDLMDLRLRFRALPAETARAQAQALSDALPGWSTLVRRRLADDDPWSSLPPGALKRSVDASFPVAGFALADRLASSVVLDEGGLDPDALHLDV
ncbi:MAG: hypothetical protein AB7I01_22735 [Gammaproteobacteria bacterium]